MEHDGSFCYLWAYQIALYFGVYDFTGHVKSQPEPYFDEDKWCITLPADAVDEYVLSKFNATVDRSLIEEYDSENETYMFLTTGCGKSGTSGIKRKTRNQ